MYTIGNSSSVVLVSCLIEAIWPEKSSQKKSAVYLKKEPRKSQTDKMNCKINFYKRGFVTGQ